MITALPRRENHNILRNRMTEEDQNIINEIDAHFNDVANALKTVNDCLVAIGNRLDSLEKHHNDLVEVIQNIQSVDKVLYKPNDNYDYLSIKDNLDLIYKKIGDLENV